VTKLPLSDHGDNVDASLLERQSLARLRLGVAREMVGLIKGPMVRFWTITAGLHHWYVTKTSTQYWNGTWMGTRLRRCNAWLCGFFPGHSRQRRVSGPSRILGPSYLSLETAPPTTAFTRGPGYRSALVNLAAPMAFSFSAIGF